MYFWTEVDAQKSVKYVSALRVNDERARSKRGASSGMPPHPISFHNHIRDLIAVNPSARRFFLRFRLAFQDANASEQRVR